MFITLLVALSFSLYPDPVTHLNSTPSVLVDIAWCESHQQQFKPDGHLVADYATSDHVGIYQISKTVWGSKARSMGWDITTPEGNVAMALWLYHKYGNTPWLASRDCWGSKDYA